MENKKTYEELEHLFNQYHFQMKLSIILIEEIGVVLEEDKFSPNQKLIEIKEIMEEFYRDNEPIYALLTEKLKKSNKKK